MDSKLCIVPAVPFNGGFHPSQTSSNMGLNYAAEGVRNYTLYFPPASQVMGSVCAQYRDDDIKP